MLQVSYPYYSGLEGHGLGGLKLKTQRNTHAATQWFKKKPTTDPITPPMSQRDGELTPRLRRVLREVTNEKADVFEKVAAVALTIGMVSILTVQMFWDTDNEFVHAATIHDPEIQPQLLQTLWQAASREAETVIAALAKIATVAARYGKAKAGRQVTQQWSTQAPAWPQPGKRRRANQSLRGRDTPAACAEEAKLEEALQLALSLADDIGTDSSQRLLQLRTSVMPQSEQVAILRTLFLHKARVASTLMHNIRAIARLRTWATSKGLSPWQLNTMEIAFFLRDASHGRLSVPKSLLSAMEWLQSALQLPWQLKDPAVVAVAACSARQASVHAAFPDFDNASLTLLLEYHQWVMSKAVEGPYDPAAVQALLKADFHMRTKWMLSWRQKEFPTFTEVIKHHRGHSAYLFTDIARPPRVLRETKRSRSRSRRVPDGKFKSRSPKAGAAKEHRKDRSRSPGRRAPDSWPGLVRATEQGKRICPFFNKSGGCRRGSTCPDMHMCDYPACGAAHCRVQHHPTKP